MLNISRVLFQEIIVSPGREKNYLRSVDHDSTLKKRSHIELGQGHAKHLICTERLSVGIIYQKKMKNCLFSMDSVIFGIRLFRDNAFVTHL